MLPDPDYLLLFFRLEHIYHIQQTIELIIPKIFNTFGWCFVSFLATIICSNSYR